MCFENKIKDMIKEMNNEIINNFKRKLINNKIAIYPYCNESLQLRDELLKYDIKIDFFCNNGCVLPEYNINNDIIVNIWEFKYSNLIDRTVVFNANVNNPLTNFWDLEFMGFRTDNIITPLQYNYIKKYNNMYLEQGYDINISDLENPILLNMNNCQQVYNFLTDELSKNTYLRILAKRLLDCPFYFDIFSQDVKQYFDNSIFKFNESETFVDCGALTGDTIQTFNTITNGCYEKIYAFEPETDGFIKMVNNTGSMKNIIYINTGISDKVSELKFVNLNDGSSHFIFDFEAEDTNCTIKKVLKGDALEINATFIKMDIEGYELKALSGFKNTIKKHKPKLAICIYHKIEDLWEIPLYIKSLNPDYKIFIRHYSSMLFETVCYALPE